MDNHTEVYTLRGYHRLEKSNMSPAMEDYLEMSWSWYKKPNILLIQKQYKTWRAG